MNIKHRATEEQKDRVERHIRAMCERQGVTDAQLYRIVPELAQRLEGRKT